MLYGKKTTAKTMSKPSPTKMKPAPKSIKKNERPVIDLPREIQEQFVRFAATKNLFGFLQDG